MKVQDRLLAILIVIIWGVNFTVIKFGVDGIPPLLLVALRFAFAAFPALLFIRRPQAPLRHIVAYGLTVGVGQFACLFCAIHIGMPAGAASVILQAQAFFTIFLAALFFHERIHGRQIVGLTMAAAGLAFISGQFDSQAAVIPLDSLVLTLGGALCWGLSNIVVRQASTAAAAEGKHLDVLSLVVWSSLVPPLPMLALSAWLEGPDAMASAILHIQPITIFSICYLSFLATIVGYGLWSKLLAKYEAHKIAPLSLLVPVFGLLTARFVLGESLSLWQWLGVIVVILGLVVTNMPIHRPKGA